MTDVEYEPVQQRSDEVKNKHLLLSAATNSSYVNEDDKDEERNDENASRCDVVTSASCLSTTFTSNEERSDASAARGDDATAETSESTSRCTTAKPEINGDVEPRQQEQTTFYDNQLPKLQSEARALMITINRKNVDLRDLRVQLWMATETMNELAVSQDELQRHQEMELFVRDQAMAVLKNECHARFEARSEKQRDLMNKIIQTTEQIKNAERQHRGKLDEMDRRHHAVMDEKDAQIAQLEEELRTLTSSHVLQLL